MGSFVINALARRSQDLWLDFGYDIVLMSFDSQRSRQDSLTNSQYISFFNILKYYPFL